jgi:predicted metal-dependent hydrolase
VVGRVVMLASDHRLGDFPMEMPELDLQVEHRSLTSRGPSVGCAGLRPILARQPHEERLLGDTRRAERWHHRPMALETTETARLAEGALAYTLRRNPRSRGLRVTIDPRRGVIASVPPASRRGWARPEPLVEAFLVERERWVRRHLDRHARQRATLAARGALGEGGLVRFRGTLHRIRVEPAPPGARRSSVERVGDEADDVLLIREAPRDRRSLAVVLRDWCRERAAEAIDRAVVLHAAALGVAPAGVSIRDPRSRWGSATRQGRIMLSWRLVLAPPEALDTVVVHELAHLRVFGHGPRFWALVETRRPDHRTWRRWLRTHAVELHGELADEDPGRSRPTWRAAPRPAR